jgi:hypothetical protein
MEPEISSCLQTFTISALKDIAPYNIVALMIDGVSISETSVYFYETTRRNIP